MKNKNDKTGDEMPAYILSLLFFFIENARSNILYLRRI